ncbi:MAG TPA: response regulator transcription factor [Planctomycetota bacterium]
MSKLKAVQTRPRARVFIVDDHPIVRKGIADLLRQAPDMEVCGDAATIEDALRQIAELAPDLVVVDLSLPGAGGLDLLKDLSLRHPRLKAVVLSMHDETLFAERSLRAGARGYVMKQEAVNELETALRRVLEGKIYLSPAMSERLLHFLARGKAPNEGSPLERLSDRELEVFEMIGRGMATREIARKLHLSVKTIESHREHIKGKLALPTAAKLVQHAAQWVQGR